MAVLTQDQADGLADRLAAAEQERVGIARPSGENPALTVEDAYRVQQIGIERRLASGERLVGRKIGLTSRAMQQQLGVDQPDFGAITDAMVVPNGGSLDTAALIAPRLEPEYAFRIGENLPPSPSYGEVRASIDAVALSIEVIDSRVSNWDIGLVDTSADNASSARIAVGEWRAASPELLDAIVDGEISLLRDGAEVASGPGSAVLGDPVAAIHWLATAIGAFGQSLERGSTVLAGAVCAAAPLEPGTAWECRSEGFAPVSLVAL